MPTLFFNYISNRKVHLFFHLSVAVNFLVGEFRTKDVGEKAARMALNYTEKCVDKYAIVASSSIRSAWL